MWGDFSDESNEEKKRKTGSSRLIILLVVLVILMSTIFGLVMYSQVPGESQKENQISDKSIKLSTPQFAHKIKETNQATVCMTDKCIISASRIISSMNSSVDPCHDFYRFACGGDIDSQQISERGSTSAMGELEELVEHRVRKIFDEGISASMPETVKQAIDYYEKCIDEGTQNENGTLSMFVLLELMGLPRVKTNYSPQNKPWPEVLIQGDKITGKTPFFSIEIEQKNGSSYLTFKREMIKTKTGGKKLFNFYSSLVKIAADYHDNEAWMLVDELQKLTDGQNVTLNETRLDWKKFLTSFLEDSFFKFDLEKDKILVRSPSRAKELFLMLNSKKNINKIDLFTWFFYYYSMAPYTKTEFRDKYFEMDPIARLNGPMPTDLKTRCTKLACDLFPDAINYEYLSRYFDEERKQKTERMVDDIHQAFIQLITDLDWMDEQTKRLALDKLDAVKPNIGYPEWLFNPAVLDERNIFLKDVKEDWLNMNLKAYIAATKKFDLSLNYASLGAIIGHKQFMNCFDNIDQTIDKNGEQKNWFSNETMGKFDEHVQCMIDQYSQFHLLEFGANLNGAQTIGENMADNGGLREALIVYDWFKNRQTHIDDGTEILPDPEPYLPGLTGYSHKQLFFLGFANMWCQNESLFSLFSLRLKDKHSPSRNRVLGTLANNKEFAEAWKCPVGSKMNPVDKCIAC
ncbi:endothelin-converting enzyme homolog [Cloeon dipterum]|uniref:endothelin-converting enzyme homolog n=1 Tax=Cloeon dipterum TaxID=197152 RepID=UPI00321FF491